MSNAGGGCVPKDIAVLSLSVRRYGRAGSAEPARRPGCQGRFQSGRDQNDASFRQLFHPRREGRHDQRADRTGRRAHGRRSVRTADRQIVAAIRKISDQPIRFLVNTHVHGDHTGGNENFAKLGALILSRDQLRLRLMNPSPGPNGVAPPSAPANALPIITYDGPVTLHINGEDVQLIPIRAAHTDGDTLIRFPKHDMLAVGDYYRGIGYPFVDIFNGGTLDGLLVGLGETIALAGPKTKIIPGHGAIVDRNAVIAQRDLVLEMRDRMLPLLARGMSVEEVLAANITADTDASIPEGTQTAEQFVRWLYAELRKPH